MKDLFFTVYIEQDEDYFYRFYSICAKLLRAKRDPRKNA